MAADAVGGVPLATKLSTKGLGGVTDKVQALVGSAKSDLSGMSKAEKIAYAMQQIESTKKKNAVASTLVAARQRATGTPLSLPPWPNPNPNPDPNPEPNPDPDPNPNPEP